MERKRIRIINPITHPPFRTSTEEAFAEIAGRGSLLGGNPYEVVQIPEGEGPITIESAYDSAFAESGTIRLAEQAERDGASAAVINCLGDCAYHAAREAVDIPVTAPFETSVRFAQLLGSRIAVCVASTAFIRKAERLAKEMGAAQDVVFVGSVDIPVSDLSGSHSLLAERLTEKYLEAIREKGADVMILGCTGMVGLADTVHAMLLEKGYDVPVIDPAEAAARFAEVLVAMDLRQSRILYPKETGHNVER